ncbi:outer membrane protein assembly factor BamE [Ramlibacter alkalitolerans]|uniref:Outer membrane protein assembly factor BamE n=1 Tax=Ramlibacter alkalitolerans TaxID=2039631 RepID=A0ABS1JSM8_9BURK|nr:outer membrane protein assembly factor BamE [Ramlibacter alkalitolerans]MBL0427176.1 outer membrane protein assembly factor BamE [Ramlibacter alkalitolerans]
MLVKTLRQSRIPFATVALALLAGCGSYDNIGRRVSTALTPYRAEVVQGNFVSREQVQSLQPGMSREQVRQALGTPLVSSLFHADRWDYVFTLRRQGVEPQQRHLAVFFKGDAMERVEGGETMPSEAEFVSTLDKRKSGKVPRLEATEEELRAASARQAPAAPAPQPAATPAAPAAATNYPPLEAPAR